MQSRERKITSIIRGDLIGVTGELLDRIAGKN